MRARRVLVVSWLLLGLAGCSKPRVDVAESGGESPAAQRHGSRRLPPRVSGALPTATESELALSLGKEAFEQGELDDAEEALKVASAGGRSEADGLLLKVATERTGKEKLSLAREKYAAKDYKAAEQALAAVPVSSVLRPKADELGERVSRVREREEAKRTLQMQQGLEKDMPEVPPEAEKDRE